MAERSRTHRAYRSGAPSASPLRSATAATTCTPVSPVGVGQDPQVAAPAGRSRTRRRLLRRPVGPAGLTDRLGEGRDVVRRRLGLGELALVADDLPPAGRGEP